MRFAITCEPCREVFVTDDPRGVAAVNRKFKEHRCAPVVLDPLEQIVIDAAEQLAARLDGPNTAWRGAIIRHAIKKAIREARTVVE